MEINVSLVLVMSLSGIVLFGGILSFALLVEARRPREITDADTFIAARYFVPLNGNSNIEVILSLLQALFCRLGTQR